MDSHVRLAAPARRNPPPMVRRSYSYDRGNGDIGLIFACFQRDLVKGFEAVQKRLAGEAMAKCILTHRRWVPLRSAARICMGRCAVPVLIARSAPVPGGGSGGAALSCSVTWPSRTGRRSRRRARRS
ncbi:hypothetical protein ACFWNC_28885 [Streptomyces sp. NPDC058369]|uniref:hypothetical protein n=1 Tax=unclassified Streptomyces TaxID=2593676 RepID=UPI0034535531